MENQTKVKHLYKELKELARQEVLRELKEEFLKEKDFESLKKLEELENS